MLLPVAEGMNTSSSGDAGGASAGALAYAGAVALVVGSKRVFASCASPYAQDEQKKKKRQKQETVAATTFDLTVSDDEEEEEGKGKARAAASHCVVSARLFELVLLRISSLARKKNF